MSLAERFLDFLDQPEQARFFARKNWSDAIPHIDAVTPAEDGRLYREQVQRAADQDTALGAVASLVWGYPLGYTKHLNINMPANLQSALRDELPRIVDAVEELRSYPTSPAKAVARLNRVPGIHTASSTKVLYFARVETTEGRSLIFDREVIGAVLNVDVPELLPMREALLGKLSRDKPREWLVGKIIDNPRSYDAYMREIRALGKLLDPRADLDDVERFIFLLDRP